METTKQTKTVGKTTRVVLALSQDQAQDLMQVLEIARKNTVKVPLMETAEKLSARISKTLTKQKAKEETK